MSDTFTGFEHTLEAKHGPLPTWAWGALAGGVVILLRRRKAKTAPVAVAPPLDPSLAGNDPNTYTDGTVGTVDQTGQVLDSYLAGDATNPAQNVGIGNSGLPQPVTNAQWARVTANYLMGQGNAPDLVQNALAKYLAGSPLSQAEDAVVNLALAFAGTPPEGVLPVNGSGQTSTTTPPAGTSGGFTGERHIPPTSSWGSPTRRTGSPTFGVAP